MGAIVYVRRRIAVENPLTDNFILAPPQYSSFERFWNGKVSSVINSYSFGCKQIVEREKVRIMWLKVFIVNRLCRRVGERNCVLKNKFQSKDWEIDALKFFQLFSWLFFKLLMGLARSFKCFTSNSHATFSVKLTSHLVNKSFRNYFALKAFPALHS